MIDTLKWPSRYDDNKVGKIKLGHGPEVIAGLRVSKCIKLNIGGYYNEQEENIRGILGIAFRVNKQ